MNYKKTSQLPNIVVDSYLKILSEKELKILLLVLRQTVGFTDGKGGRKQKDWLSQKFIASRTGLSFKSVSLGIDQLIKKKLIIAYAQNGAILHSAEARKGSQRILYATTFFQKKTSENYSSKAITKSNTTKLTHTKLSTVPNPKTKVKRLSDWERYCQIIGRTAN